MFKKLFPEGPEQQPPQENQPEQEKLIKKEGSFIKGIIEVMGDEVAQIRLVDGQLISWERKKIPEGCHEGDEVTLSLLSGEELAKEILNTILNPQEENEKST